MRLFRLILYLGISTTLMASPTMEYQDTELPTLQRRKRYLAFPKGSSLQLVYCFVVGAYGSNNLFTVGITIGAAWEIPENVVALLKGGSSPSSVRRRHARSLYPTLEDFLQRLGVNGRACVLRAICEATHTDRRSMSFIEGVMHTIFTFPDTSDEEELPEDEYFAGSSIYDTPRKNASSCFQYHKDCPTSILDLDLFT